MSPNRLRALLPVAVLLGACSSPSNGGAITGSLDPGKGDIVAEEGGGTCTAVMRWLQKDAYASRAGRTTELWPPHTTMALDIECEGAPAIHAFRENHGTRPGAVDADGKEILVEVKRSESVSASASRMRALLSAFAACECAPATEFLSLESVDDQRREMILDELAAYVGAHMSCAGATLSELTEWLTTGRIDEVLGALSTCAWDDGSDWGTGFDHAVAAVLGPEVAGTHVCNNDAMLESQLWADFAAGKATLACDNKSAVCSGPRFFYNP